MARAPTVGEAAPETRRPCACVTTEWKRTKLLLENALISRFREARLWQWSLPNT
jgi:hypothetical protein